MDTPLPKPGPSVAKSIKWEGLGNLIPIVKSLPSGEILTPTSEVSDDMEPLANGTTCNEQSESVDAEAAHELTWCDVVGCTLHPSCSSSLKQ